MAGSVYVVAEQWRGQLSEVTYEILALGREVADQLLVPLRVVLAGHNARSLARRLGCADSVLYLDHPQLAEPVPESCADALIPVVRERKPQCVLVPSTNVSLGIGALLASELGVQPVNLCEDLRVIDGSFEATCTLYGGKVEAIVTIESTPAVFGIRPGARRARAGQIERSALVEDVAVSLPEEPQVRLKRYIPPETADVDVTKEDVLVAIGRGIESRDNLHLAEGLAEALGGAVCSSRPPVDWGWLPLSRQVGCSGMMVRPKLYLALGISGAPEHVEGMRDAGMIVAVNTDPRAPIFEHAQYGVVADAIEFLPVLTRTIRSSRNPGAST